MQGACPCHRTSPSMKSGRGKGARNRVRARRGRWPCACRSGRGIASRRTRAGVGARSAARARAAPTGADDVRGAPGRRRLADLGSLGVMADGSVVDEQHDRRAGIWGDQSGRSDDGEVPRAGGQPRERRCDGGRLEPGPLDAGLHPVPPCQKTASAARSCSPSARRRLADAAGGAPAAGTVIDARPGRRTGGRSSTHSRASRTTSRSPGSSG